MNQIKLVIFDLDGTAADTMDGIVEGLNRAMRECGYPLHTRESVLKFVNYHTRRYIEEALPASARTDAEIDRVLDVRPAASLKAGGAGLRYTVRIGRTETYLFLEETRWFVERRHVPS